MIIVPDYSAMVSGMVHQLLEKGGDVVIGNKTLAPVGYYSPAGDSPYGLADMAGNIWQWTSSHYWLYPFDLKSRRDKRDYNGLRVSRGGAFNESQLKAPCAWRERFDSSTRRPNLGFRLACESRFD